MDFVRPVQAVIPGVQGEILAVLAETTADLNLRTLARLAGVSVAQASRVMPTLVELGLVDRHEVPPSSQFRLNRHSIAAQMVVDLARSRDITLERLRIAASSLSPSPISIIVFGSFARGEADAYSDLDVVILRPENVDEEDDAWTSSIEAWRTDTRALTGNRVEVLEVSEHEAHTRFASDSSLWNDVAREGIAVHGLTIDELLAPVHA